MRGQVSVIMPVYNCARYVAQAVDSVLSQGYSEKELIVVDDGSTDETLEVLERYGDRLRLLRQHNRGAASARNHALSKARGDLVAFIDGDDVWLPGKLAAQVAYLRAHPGAKLLYGRWCEWRPDASGNWPDPQHFADGYDESSVDPGASGWIYTKLLFDSIVCTITTMMPTQLLRSVGGFDEELRIGEDYDLWLRLSRLVEAHKMTMMMAAYRIHTSSTTRKPPCENYGHRVLTRALQRYGVSGPDGATADLPEVRRRLQQLSIDFGYYHFMYGDPCAAAVAYRQARLDGASSARLSAYELAARLRCALRRSPPEVVSQEAKT
jgi:glycosyltransferase involved in cell wall biosynthesis